MKYTVNILKVISARETVAVKGLPRNVNVEISMIAVK
jgi:enamine deaminase RidA (YjgF/YER057c/UK114 family)